MEKRVPSLRQGEDFETSAIGRDWTTMKVRIFWKKLAGRGGEPRVGGGVASVGKTRRAILGGRQAVQVTSRKKKSLSRPMKKKGGEGCSAHLQEP